MTNCLKIENGSTKPEAPLNRLTQQYIEDNLLPDARLKSSKKYRFLQKAISVGFTGEECEALIALYGKHL